MKKRVAFYTLGCKLNFTETALLSRRFIEQGYEIVDFDSHADVCVINTCTVTERADRECRQIIRRAKRRSPDSLVAVVGCFAQLNPDEFASIEGVNLVLGSKEKFDILQYLSKLQETSFPQVFVTPIEHSDTAILASSDGYSERIRIFLKIQDGCDYSCAFCTIPLARGLSRSVPERDILNQAQKIVDAGFKEIVLTGVNVGDYGRKSGSNILTLLKGLVQINGLKRLRISSIEPNLITDELLDFWVGNDILCKHWHIPLQSGSDEILKKMRRRYLTDWYANRIYEIKKRIPSAGIGLDVIAGFPGETIELFNETYRFLVDLPISYLHVFTYSERPNTAAIQMLNHIEPRIKFERSEMLRNLSAKKRRQFNETFVGKIVNVLFESEEKSGLLSGLIDEYVRVNVKGNVEMKGEIVPVRITGYDSNGCTGICEDEIKTSVFSKQRSTLRMTQCN